MDMKFINDVFLIDLEIVQHCQKIFNSWWNCQPNVSWCPALYGPDNLPAHHLVRPISNYCRFVLSVADPRSLIFGRYWGDGVVDTIECSTRQQKQTVSSKYEMVSLYVIH